MVFRSDFKLSKTHSLDFQNKDTYTYLNEDMYSVK